PHELVRAAVYADLAPARRHDLHRTAAGLLGGSAGVDHRIAAAVGPDPALAAELTALGRAEADARRWSQAADRLSAAADLSAGPPTRGLGHVLGRLEALTGRFDTARETLTAALHTADGDDGGRAVAAAHLALVSLIEGDAGPAARLAAAG